MKKFICLALLAGCSSGPDYQAPKVEAFLPQHIQTRTKITRGWWTDFHDPVLDILVDAALEHNPDLESAAANIRQSRAGLSAIAAQDSPQLNAAGRAGHDQLSREGENFANIPFPDPKTAFNDYRAGFDASCEIDFFGHNARSIEAASARLDSVALLRSDISLRVAAETVRNLLDYRYWQRRYENAAKIAIHQRELLRLASLQQQAGVISLMDMSQAELNVHSADAALPPLLAAKQAALAALGPLTSLPQEQIAGLLATPQAAPALPENAPLVLASELLLRRPDLRYSERQLAAASADINVAMAEQYPRFNLVGNAGWASRFWNLGPQFSIPLLTGGRLKAHVKAAEAARDAALAGYRKAVLLALAEVETALIRCQGDRVRAQELQLARTAQDKLLSFARQRYQAGETPGTELLEAELRVAGINELQLATGQALASDLVALYKALGGSAKP
jgi:NodT family efflux transporter outer membrane factor (OMF) lipoprotein